jgi:hypothetical protein
LLHLTLEKGQTTAYPASSDGPSTNYRFWATAVRGSIQFGIQARQLPFEDKYKDALNIFGFKHRDNGRELYLILPFEAENALPLAKIAVNLIRDVFSYADRTPHG